MSRFNSKPNTNIPEKEKDADWHKSFIKSIISDSLDTGFENAFKAMQTSYDFYDGNQNSDATAFLQESEGGEVLPALWINYNKIRTKVNLLVGELNAKGYSIRARAVNKEAVSAKLDKKYEMLAKMNIKQDLSDLEAASGLPTAPTEFLPETKEDLEDFITNTYKDNSEKVLEAALKYLVAKYEFQQMRLSLFRDLVITARAFVRVKVEEGLPKYERVDPRYVVFDTNCKDDFLSDSSNFGVVEMVSLAEATQLYKLTKDEIEEIKDGNNSEVDRLSTENINAGFSQQKENDMKVLVFHAEWQDTKSIKRKESEDKYGNKHYKKVKDNAKGKNIISSNIKVWRKGTLIGGTILRDYGIKENMIRSVDDIHDTKPSIISLCHNYVNFRSVSTVQLLEGLQTSKDLCMYQTQLAINRSGPKGFTYDISQIPEGWDVEEVLRYLKTSGIVVTNSKKDGIHTPGSAFQEFDMTVSNSLSQYMAYAQMIDREMDLITGVNQERQGQVNAASQAVGVTQAAITSSQLSTEPMFEAFRSFEQKIMNQLAGLVKIVYGEDKERFSPIIGDAGVDFLKNDVDLHLQDYGVFLNVIPPQLADHNKFEQLLTAALQAGKVEITDALDLIRETGSGGDVDLAISRLKRAIEKREKDRKEQEMAMQQQQQQAMMQQQQMMQQATAQEMQMKAQQQEAYSEQGHQNRMKETMLKERLDIQKNL